MSDSASPSSSSSDGHDGTTTMAISAIVIVLAVISVVLRFYTRLFTKAQLKADDWLILLAVLSAVLTGALSIWGNAVDPNSAAAGENSDPNFKYTPEDIFYLKLAFTSSILYFTIAGSTKLSILLMYNRLFSVNQSFRWQLMVVSLLVVGFWVGCTVATLTNCIPLKWSWLNSLSDARYCFNYNIFWMASGACEVLIDVMILALPMQVVWELQLSRRKKATVACIFLLGGFAIVTGLVKVVLGYVPHSRVPSYSRTEVWTTVHAGMSIVCACLPIFKPLATRVGRSGFVSRLRSSASRGKSWLPSVRSDSGGRGGGSWLGGSSRGSGSGKRKEQTSWRSRSELGSSGEAHEFIERRRPSDVSGGSQERLKPSMAVEVEDVDGEGHVDEYRRPSTRERAITEALENGYAV